MAKSFPFESKKIIGNEWDRAITAQDERDFNKMCWGNGVFINPIDGLMVTAHGGMTVNVKPGGAIIEGAVFKESSNRQITLSPASSLPRIDRIVLRFDTAEDRRDIDIYLKEGVAATNPVAQDLIRESNYYELAIADIYIPARTTSIESVNISDTRMDSNLCGWVVPAVEYKGLFDNLWLQLRDSFGTVNSALSGTLAQDLKQEIKSTDEKYADQIKSVRDDMGNVNMLKTSARNLADAINEIFNKFKNQKKLIKSGDVYWGGGTWVCPDDGFITMRVTCKAGAPYVLLYVVDSTNAIVGSVYGEGSGGTFTTMIPVHKGERYKTSYAIGYGAINAFYSKLGSF